MINSSLALRLCGFLYIYILITNAVSVGLGDKTGETDSEAIISTIAENPIRFKLGINLAIMSHIGILAIVGMLYLAFSSYNKQLALIGSVFRLGEAITMIYSELGVLGLIQLSEEYLLNNSNKESIIALGEQVLVTKNIIVDLGLLFLSIGALIYCIILVRNGVGPPKVAWLGLIAGVLSVIGILVKFVNGGNILAITGMIAMMTFEIFFGIWSLIFSK